MKKLLVMVILMVSEISYSQRLTDTTIYQPMFYGANTYGSKDKDVIKVRKIVRESEFSLLNEWYKENIDSIYGEFIRLVNEERSHLTVNKKFIIYLNEHDYNSTYKGFKYSGDSVLLITNKSEAKKLSKQIQEEYNVVDVYTQKIRLGNYVGDRIWIEYVTPVNKLKFDSLTSLASFHHNKYMINEGVYRNTNWYVKDSVRLISHGESSKECPYHDTTIIFAYDRVKYFTNDTRINMGEIIAMTIFFDLLNPTFIFEREERYDVEFGEYAIPTKLKNNPYKEIAYELFDGFKKSKKHYELIMMESNVDMIGMNLLFDGGKNSFFTVNIAFSRK